MTKMSVKHDKKTLPQKHQKAVRALLTHRSISEAADYSGVSERTIYRWMDQTNFRIALTKAESEIIDDSFRLLLSDLGDNLGTMRTIRDDTSVSSSVRLRAAMALDSTFLRWKEIRDIEQRLTVLEVNFEEQNSS